jgi:hypothetical protein
MANNTSTSSASDFGVKPMQVAAPLPGSNGSIHENNSAMIKQSSQNQVNGRFGGSKGGAVTIPPVQVNYKESGVGNTSTNGNVAAITRTQTNIYAAKEFDSQVGQKAGRRRSKSHRLTKGRQLTKGGWPAWGCMSGGKRRRRKSCKKYNKKSRRRSYKKR